MEWLNYHHLMNFWMVAREGGVLPAARALHVSPASVSIQVNQLEKALGVELFEKQGRRLVLTATGVQVAEYASEIFETGRELLNSVKGQAARGPRALRVGIRDVMPKLVAFRLIQPALNMPEPIRLECHEGEMGRLVDDLALYKLDLVLSDTPLDWEPKVRAKSCLLGESSVVLVGAASLAKKYRRDFPERLNGAPLLLPTNSSALRPALEHWLEDRGLKPTRVAEFADSAMLKIAGRAALGLFAIPSIIADVVQKMYQVTIVGELPGLKERFYGIAMERQWDHPALQQIRGPKELPRSLTS